MNNTKRFVAIIGIGLAVIMPINRAFGLKVTTQSKLRENTMKILLVALQVCGA